MDPPALPKRAEDDSRVDVPWQLPVVLLAIFVLESIIVLHTLAPTPSPWAFLFLGLLTPRHLFRARWVQPPKPWELRHHGAVVLGAVAGEAIGYFVAVPWQLTLACFQLDDHHVPVTLLLRLVCLLLGYSAWKMARRGAGPAPETSWRRAATAGGLALGLLTALGVVLVDVLFPIVKGHRPRSEVEAEWRAAAQLGPEYAGYRYFVRQLHLVIRRGEGITYRASVIAYDLDATDVQDVPVTWKEPWTGPR